MDFQGKYKNLPEFLDSLFAGLTITSCGLVGLLIYYNRENAMHSILIPIICGILIAIVTVNFIKIALNILAVFYTGFKPVKGRVSDLIPICLFLLWIFVQAKTSQGVLLLYGAGIYLFIHCGVIIGTKLRDGITKEFRRVIHTDEDYNREYGRRRGDDKS